MARGAVYTPEKVYAELNAATGGAQGCPTAVHHISTEKIENDPAGTRRTNSEVCEWSVPVVNTYYIYHVGEKPIGLPPDCHKHQMRRRSPVCGAH